MLTEKQIYLKTKKMFKGVKLVCKEDFRKYGLKNIKKRERCNTCGKLFGKNKGNHSCKHPRGMLGKHHTKTSKEKISKFLKNKSWVERYGKEKAELLKKNISKKMIEIRKRKRWGKLTS